MALVITIDGATFDSFVDFNSVKIQQNHEVKGSTMTFDVYIYAGSAPRPEAGNEVILTDGGTKEFAGTLLTVGFIQGEGGAQVKFPCVAVDYTFMLDRRYVTKLYDASTVKTMFTAILLDLKNASVGPDTFYNSFHSDLSQMSDGPVVPRRRFEKVLPSQAFDLIAESAGMQWWIDFDKRIHLITNEQNNALHLPALTLDVENDVDNFFDLHHEESISGIGTQPIIRDAKIKSTTAAVDAFVWNTSMDRVFRLSRTVFDELSVTEVDVAGTDITTQDIEDVDGSPGDGGGDSDTYYLFIGSEKDQSYIRLSDAVSLSNGNVVTITYFYNITDDHESIQTDAVAELASRTGGDGYHQYVFSQASGLEVEAQEELDAITDLLNDRKAKVLHRGKFKSWTKAWEAGHYFKLKWPNANIKERYGTVDEGVGVFVVNVRKTISTPADDPNISNNRILHEIEYSNVPRGVRV